MTLRHLQPVPQIKIFFAIVLAFLSVYLFFAGSYYGLILLAAALRLGLREGVEMELEGKRYRKVYSIFAVNFGTWKKLPPIEYVSIFKTTRKTRARVITAEAHLGTTVYRINLFYERNKHLDVYESEEKENTLEIARHIATILETPIWDATIKEPNWL